MLCFLLISWWLCGGVSRSGSRRLLSLGSVLTLEPEVARLHLWGGQPAQGGWRWAGPHSVPGCAGGSGLDKEALILFSAEPAQPLPVLGLAQCLASQLLEPGASAHRAASTAQPAGLFSVPSQGPSHFLSQSERAGLELASCQPVTTLTLTWASPPPPEVPSSANI